MPPPLPGPGPGGAAFPATRRSLVVGARSPDAEVRRRAEGAVVEAYWKPAYKYVRLKWGTTPPEAEDLVQGFFARALEKGLWASYDPAQARFRTYLRTCLDHHAANERKAAGRQRRGGGLPAPSLDFAEAEGELAHQAASPALGQDELFHREWVRHLFGLAVERLRARCEERAKPLPFELFRVYDLEGDVERPSYAALAARHGIPVTQVTNLLSWARAELRAAVLELLEEITGSEEELRAEARALLGIDPP